MGLAVGKLGKACKKQHEQNIGQLLPSCSEKRNPHLIPAFLGLQMPLFPGLSWPSLNATLASRQPLGGQIPDGISCREASPLASSSFQEFPEGQVQAILAAIVRQGRVYTFNAQCIDPAGLHRVWPEIVWGNIFRPLSGHIRLMLLHFEAFSEAIVGSRGFYKFRA